MTTATVSAAAPPPPPTRFHQRLWAELLTLRPAEGAERLTATLAGARVDLNPHQIEAAAFALDALATGGCVLADEVGLGKTIEAGLVIAQLLAEGAKRILILCPATLRAQWQAELIDKLGVEARVVDGNSPPKAFEGPSPVIASLPFGALRARELAQVPWDLAVIDEAHRLRNAYRPTHKTGQALKGALKGRPKLLLTATPFQNDLLELFGLVSLVDERALGPEEAFRDRFASEAGVSEARAEELKARLSPVVHRTLRRQVKEYVRFTHRRSVVEDFAPGPEESRLYEEVSAYLRRADALALNPARRTLMVLVCRKLLASSTFAIAPTLKKLADGLEARTPAEMEELAHYAEEAEEWLEEGSTPHAARAGAVTREVAELRALAAQAEAIHANAKGAALTRALHRMFTVARAHQWPEKAVVFTESRRTQDYLFTLLSQDGHAGTISVLSGDSGGVDARRDVVEAFRDRSRILLSTEAGAEGLNLQFCNVVVNYDLPWNPQRLEQRIGRCHRYGQARDVLVLNFLNRQNAADARLYELLDQKLHLFDGVFGASDEILGALGNGLDFERRVLDIYQSCRSPSEIDGAFDALRAELEETIDRKMSAAHALLLERFDGDVRKRLKLTRDRAAVALDWRARTTESLRAAQSEAVPSPAVHYLKLDGRALPEALQNLKGAEGWWFAYRVGLSGLRPGELLLHLVLVREGEAFRAVPLEPARRFLELPAAEEPSRRPAGVPVAAFQEKALEHARAALAKDAERAALRHRDAAREAWDRYAEDCLAAPRDALARAQAAWEAARVTLTASCDSDAPKARKDLDRAEGALKRQRALLRAKEDEHYGERDRAVAALSERARVLDQRTLVASAYWWL